MGVYSILVPPRASKWQTKWRLAHLGRGKGQRTFPKKEKEPPSSPKESVAQRPAPSTQQGV